MVIPVCLWEAMISGVSLPRLLSHKPVGGVFKHQPAILFMSLLGYAALPLMVTSQQSKRAFGVHMAESWPLYMNAVHLTFDQVSFSFCIGIQLTFPSQIRCHM